MFSPSRRLGWPFDTSSWEEDNHLPHELKEDFWTAVQQDFSKSLSIFTGTEPADARSRDTDDLRSLIGSRAK